MSARDRLADTRSLLAAATNAPDLELRVIFAAHARNTLDELERDVAMCASSLAHLEAELVRVAKGRAP